MSKVRVVCQTISYGKNRYKRHESGVWEVMLFGTTGPGQTPHYSWADINESKVPREVVECANKTK